ncbi:MAG: DUF58 domain-containing protein [Leptolyngbya sp. SIO4C5]|nr:DUF58 domain-containing protein [Leptolyngbya sp. SIO4C5]
MNISRTVNSWLTHRWVSPAYSGWVLLGLTVFFFGAATNTLAGWLYVISGVMLALLAIAAVLPPRLLRGLRVERLPVRPVSAGNRLRLDVRLRNATAQTKGMLQICDLIPPALGGMQTQAIAQLKPGNTYHWQLECFAKSRGLYHWQTVQLRTAAPFGLFWCHRDRPAKVTAIVYPTVLPLSQCPLLDQPLGQAQTQRWLGDRHYQSATEGVTRSLRPYRWGDPTRLIHWRTSARYGDLRVRELEHFSQAQTLTLCLDSATIWQHDNFEQAVIAAASLYCYGLQRGITVAVWTAQTGSLREKNAVLRTLAAVKMAEPISHALPSGQLIWLSETPNSRISPTNSYWIRWQNAAVQRITQAKSHPPYLQIDAALPLVPQLQALANISSRPGS